MPGSPERPTATGAGELPLRRPRGPRFDHFWSPAWREGGRVAWEPSGADPRRIPALLEDPLARRVAAVLAQWRLADKQQLDAVTGAGTTHVAEALGRLKAAGVVQRGRFRRATHVQAPDLWRLHQPEGARRTNAGSGLTAEADMYFAEQPTYRDWVSITSGYRPTRGPIADRHNALATELGIRIVDTCPSVGAVYGERLAGAYQMIDPRLMPSGQDGGIKRRGDLVAVRNDGFRIVLDIARRAGQTDLRPKAEAWAELMSTIPPGDLNVIVVLVDASDHVRPRPPSDTQLAAVAQAREQGAAGGNRRWADGRILMASWSEWFPTSDTTSTTFPTLTSWSPRVDGMADQVRLLDPVITPFETADVSWWRTPLTEARHLLGVFSR